MLKCTTGPLKRKEKQDYYCDTARKSGVCDLAFMKFVENELDVSGNTFYYQYRGIFKALKNKQVF
jgi:hypothetical protein